MCWTADNKRKIERYKKTARQNLTVYKYTEEPIGYKRKYFFGLIGPKLTVITSESWRYKYILGRKNPKISITVDSDEISWYIQEGYHSLKYPPAINARRYTILKCTIPKGTTYYENSSGEIVSEELIITEIIKR